MKPTQKIDQRLSFLLPRLMHGLRRMGWPAFLGLACLAVAVFLDVVTLSGLDEQQAQLRKQRNQLRAQLVTAAEQADTPALKLEQLNEKARVDALMGDLHTLAKTHQVVLEQGEYRLETQGGTRLARYRMVLPAKASYPNLRAWLSAIAAAEPGLLLDDLSLKRENITQEALEARVTFSLLVRAS